MCGFYQVNETGNGRAEKFFYRINPSAVAFLWHQVDRNEDGSFGNEKTNEE